MWSKFSGIMVHREIGLMKMLLKYQIVKKIFMMKTLLGAFIELFFIFIKSNLKILKKSIWTIKV